MGANVIVKRIANANCMLLSGFKLFQPSANNLRVESSEWTSFSSFTAAAKSSAPVVMAQLLRYTFAIRVLADESLQTVASLGTFRGALELLLKAHFLAFAAALPLLILPFAGFCQIGA